MYGQNSIDTIYNFKIEKTELIWQKVYKSEVDSKELFKKEVVSSLRGQNLQEFENRISFVITNDKIDFKRLGGKWGNTPSYVQVPQNYLVIVDFKPSKYRVTIKSIETDFSAVGMGKNLLSELVVKRRNSKFRGSESHKRALKYYDLYFQSKFEIKQKKDNW